MFTMWLKILSETVNFTFKLSLSAASPHGLLKCLRWTVWVKIVWYKLCFVAPTKSRKVATVMNASQHPCPNLHCSKVFTTPQYLQRHRLKCKASEIGRLVSIHCMAASPIFLNHAPNELTPCSISLTSCHQKCQRVIKHDSLYAEIIPSEKFLTFLVYQQNPLFLF